MKEKVKSLMFRVEDIFFLKVVRNGLTLMIPLILLGGIACAFMNLPFPNYVEAFSGGKLSALYQILHAIYQGTFGMFSVLLVAALSISYGMERNEPLDQAVIYVVVALGAFGAQLNLGSELFDLNQIGPQGSFSAIVITLLACFAYSKLKNLAKQVVKRYTVGMEVVCASAIQAVIPAIIVIGVTALLSELLTVLFGVANLQELFSNFVCSFFANINNDFSSSLLYTILLHVLWILGFHGSHLLEPVAQTNFQNVSGEVIFSKSFFDTYVVMGGCGTTICVLVALILFFRKDRMGKLAKLASFTVIFNLNEVFTLGIPIILNPILAIPFIVTPFVSFLIAYGTTVIGFLPRMTETIPWATPILFSGYKASGSLRGVVVQLICIAVGVCIYMPFLKLNKQVRESYAKEQVQKLVRQLQEYEENNETPLFLSRADRVGVISRMLLQDLQTAIEDRELYLLFQPQVDANNRCIGAEALLRWNHPLYGFVHPPLIIYLAKEGGILPQLELMLFDKAIEGIKKTTEVYDGPFKISVNITGKSLLWDIEACIDGCLKKYHVPPERLWIEITEQDVISNASHVVDKLRRLKEKGHTLLIDDFGMGHTSLKYLQSNHFGVVKLDGSLVRKVLESKTNQKIVGSIVKLGKELDVQVIAEFVETEEQRDKLLELGCEWYQGYLYSKPIPLDEFIQFIKKHND